MSERPPAGVRIPGRRTPKAEKDRLKAELAKELRKIKADDNARSRPKDSSPPADPFGNLLPRRPIVLEMPELPLSEPYGEHRAPKLNDEVIVWWGEARGVIGTVTSVNPGACYLSPTDPSHKQFAGFFRTIALRRIVRRPPKFKTQEEAEAWMDLCNPQEYPNGTMVRLSEEQDRDKAIQHVKVLDYDDEGPKIDSPPHYLVAILDANGIPIEVKNVAYYFIHGRANSN